MRGGSARMDRLFDPVLVFWSRLGIVASLANGDPLSFTELSKHTGLADGNLHVQAGKLIEAGYVSSSRERTGGRARTIYRITEAGERRYKRLIATLEQSLERPPTSLQASPGEREKDESQVW